jgi:hypothetical protein
LTPPLTQPLVQPPVHTLTQPSTCPLIISAATPPLQQREDPFRTQTLSCVPTPLSKLNISDQPLQAFFEVDVGSCKEQYQQAWKYSPTTRAPDVNLSEPSASTHFPGSFPSVIGESALKQHALFSSVSVTSCPQLSSAKTSPISKPPVTEKEPPLTFASNVAGIQSWVQVCRRTVTAFMSHQVKA